MKKFKDYLLSEKTGFLINQEEIVPIPIYYTSWIELKSNLESHIDSRTLAKYVEEMPILSLDYLTNDEERRYCRCILAMITTAYVWHQRDTYVPKVLPKSLAVPFLKLSEYFGIKPILTHTDLVIMNTIVDVTKTYCDESSLRIKEQIISNINWTVFQRETARIELCFTPIISAIERLCSAIENNNIDAATSFLLIICDVVRRMQDSMKTFNEMDPDYFHTQMRPYLVGWSGDSFPNPGGLLYENEDGSYTKIECIGASAAQSPTLQALDNLFKIEHSQENQTFFDIMKLYMLREHREFLNDLKDKVHLDKFVHVNKNNEGLMKAYGQCFKAISMFRTGHMQIVTKFIINPAKKIEKATAMSEFLQQKGTGGQDLLNFLKEVRDDVQETMK